MTAGTLDAEYGLHVRRLNMPLSLEPARIGVLMAFGAIGGWSLNFIFARSLAGVVPPFTLSFMRICVAFIVLSPFAGKEFLQSWPVVRRRPVFYVFLSLAGIGYYNALVYTAGQTTSVINMVLLAMSTPVFTLLLSRIFLGEKLTRRRLFGLSAAVCGVTLLAVRGDIALLKTLSFHLGDLFMLLGAVFFASYNVSLSRLDPEVRGNTFIFTMLVISIVFLLPCAAAEAALGLSFSLTPLAIAGIVYLGIMASIICYILWNGAIARIGPGNVALLYYTMPLISGLEAVVLLDEPVRWYHFASGALIIAGVLVATRK